jgi:hypothetical protein
MYSKKVDAEGLAKLREHQFPVDVGVDQIYGDIEVNDISAMLEEKISIDDIFGKSIKV